MKNYSKNIELNMALLEARHEMGEVDKGGKGLNGPYVRIDDVVKEIEDKLYKHKLIATSRLCLKRLEIDKQNGIYEYREYFETIIIHAPTGQKTEPDRRPYFAEAAGRTNALQAGGAFQTYTRRYALIALLNLKGEEDTDGIIPEKHNSSTKSNNNYQNTNKNKQHSSNEFNSYLESMCNQIESLGLNLDETYKSFKTTRDNLGSMSPEGQKRLAIYLENILVSIK